MVRLKISKEHVFGSGLSDFLPCRLSGSQLRYLSRWDWSILWPMCKNMFLNDGAPCAGHSDRFVPFAFYLVDLLYDIRFLVPLGMLSGADISMQDFVLNNLLPVTFGNILGQSGRHWILPTLVFTASVCSHQL